MSTLDIVCYVAAPVFGIATFFLFNIHMNLCREIKGVRKNLNNIENESYERKYTIYELNNKLDSHNKLQEKYDYLETGIYQKIDELAHNIKKQDIYDEIKREVGENLNRIMAQNPNFNMPFNICSALSHYLNNDLEKSDILLDHLNRKHGSGGQYDGINLIGYNINFVDPNAPVAPDFKVD